MPNRAGGRPRPARRGRGAVLVGLLGASLVLLAGCGTAAASPPPTTALNSFLSAFLHRGMARAAAITIQGSKSASQLNTYWRELMALIYRAPFHPLSDLKWATHCSGLTCTATFPTFDTRNVAPLHVTLQTVALTTACRSARFPRGSAPSSTRIKVDASGWGPADEPCRLRRGAHPLLRHGAGSTRHLCELLWPAHALGFAWAPLSAASRHAGTRPAA